MILLEENRTKYILGGVVILLVLIGAAVAFQQITILNLKKEIAEKNSTAPYSQRSATINSPFTVQAVRKNLEDNIKEIKGIIISKTGNELSVDAEVEDFSKLSKLTEEELHQNSASFPKTKKNYTVIIDDKTQLGSLNPEALAEGKTVMIESNEPIYKSNRINASKVTVIGQGDVPSVGTSLEDQIKQLKFVTGQIKEINGKYLIVGAVQIDLSKIKDFEKIEAGMVQGTVKDYKVFFDDKTQYTDKKSNELEVGQSVRAFSAIPVYSISEFTATKIQGPYMDYGF